MLILGIDDAGRGPVIGPMILTGVLMDKESETKLNDLGVKDSKLLSRKKRESLVKEIKKLAIAIHTVIVSVDEIDNKVGDKLNLNQREAIASAQIINKLNKSQKSKKEIKVIIDCPSVNIKAWEEYLEKFLMARTNLKLVCEHKADTNYLVVGAASILAKVTRDNEVDKIKEQIGEDIGSGYAADPTTKKFIYENYDKYKDKGIFRESWATIKKFKSSKIQKKLF